MKRLYEFYTDGFQKLHNFKTSLPEHLQEQADEMLKNTYNLGFLGITHQVKELELERRLVEKIKLFLLELGRFFVYWKSDENTEKINAKSRRTSRRETYFGYTLV
jgi:predicted nuclease of restriction endonuclease-like (RecB) superfamily